MSSRSKVKTIIVEDNKQSREYLESLIIKNFNDIEILGYSESIVSAINLIEFIKPDLIFMDIELKDGFSFEIFNDLDFHDFEVIFVTAFNEYLREAMDHYALGYIVKPIEEVKLVDTVNRYISLKERFYSKDKLELLSGFISKDDSQILLQVGFEYFSVKVSDIIKCEADGNFTVFHLNSKTKHLVSNSLKYYENLFARKGFFKANRSTILNIKHISSIYKKEYILLRNGDRVKVSIRNRSNLSTLIKTLS